MLCIFLKHDVEKIEELQNRENAKIMFTSEWKINENHYLKTDFISERNGQKMTTIFYNLNRK